MVTTGLLVAFVTLAAGLVDLLVTSRVLWVVVFAAVCYPALRATRRESTDRAPEPWRAELIAGLAALLGLLLLVPFVGSGLATYLVAAVWVLVVYLLSAWWFG